jgi:hypothetical protein
MHISLTFLSVFFRKLIGKLTHNPSPLGSLYYNIPGGHGDLILMTCFKGGSHYYNRDHLY